MYMKGGAVISQINKDRNNVQARVKNNTMNNRVGWEVQKKIKGLIEQLDNSYIETTNLIHYL